MTDLKILQFGVEGQKQASEYGRWYWLVGLPDGRELSVFADRMQVTPSGALELRRTSGDPVPVLILAPGCWTHAYAASVFDGSPVAVESLAPPPGLNGEQP